MEVLKESSLKAVDILIDHLVFNENNVNEMNEGTLQRLVEEIQEVGFLEPIHVVPLEDGKYAVLGGEHRTKAARQAGMSYIPAIIHSDDKWNDRDLFDLVSLRLNVLKGSQNPEKFVKLYERMALKFGSEKLDDIFAITDKSVWKKLTKSIKTSLKGSGDQLSEEIGKVADKAKDFKQFTKYLDKLLKDQAQSVANGCVVITNGQNEYVVIQATDKTFELIKVFSAHASSCTQNINEYLEPALMEYLKNWGDSNE
jgi:ParB/RepB/Spo0J family partition protein